MTKSLHLLPPASLKKIQDWVGSIIIQPLNEDQTSQEITPRGTFLKNEAPLFVTPNAYLASHERIQIYNQQYWWRFFKVLHEMYPTLVRLFGHADCNQMIIVPYLTRFPSKTWSLQELGRKLPYWISHYYQESDKHLVYTSAKIDWAFQESFSIKANKPLTLPNKTPDDLADALSAKIRLQPHVHLLKCNGPFLPFRDTLLKEAVEYWLENDFPPLPKDGTYYYLIYRGPKDCLIHWETISKGQYTLLKQLQKGASLVDACSKLEEEKDSTFQEASQNIQFWFQTWMERELLTLT